MQRRTQNRSPNYDNQRSQILITPTRRNVTPTSQSYLPHKAQAADPKAANKQDVVRTIKNMVVEGPEEEARHFAPLWGGEANKAALSKQLKHR